MKENVCYNVQKTGRAIMQICFILRHPENFFFSIERVCHNLASEIRKVATVQYFTMPFASSFLGAPANLTLLPRNKDVIYHIVGDVAYASLGLPKKRTVVTYQDAVSLHRYSGLKRHILLEYFYRRPIQRAGAITTVSQFSKNELEKACGGLSRPVHLIHNPIDPIFFQAGPRDNNGHPRILQVGTTRHKNVDVTIKALAGIDSELHVVGTPEPYLVDLAQKEGVPVEWHTGINEQQLVDLYSSATLVTFASAYEGFGLPIIEAQAVGRPVITSRCCSLPEIAGDGALFVEPGNVEELRVAISQVLNDSALRKCLIDRGRRNVERFSLKRIAAEYMAIYRSLLN
jgi:glycosyltransferase involved in cell wall biosynthesis